MARINAFRRCNCGNNFVRCFLFSFAVLFIFSCFSVPIYAKSYKPLRIAKQPKSNVVAKYDGQPIELWVDARGGSEDYRYRWQRQKRGSQNWVSLKGKHDDYLELDAKYSKHRSKYRCVITDKKTKRAIISRATTLRVKTKPIIALQPQTAKTRKTGTVEYEIKAKGRHLLYQWYVSKDSGKTWHKAHSRTPKVIIQDVTSQKNGNMYRCKVTHSITGKSKTSRPAKLIVTDINSKYWYNLKNSSTKGIFKPKAVDGYIYVTSYNSKFQKYIKDACNYINKTTGLIEFIYTPCTSIADIIITDWSSSSVFYPTIYTKMDVVNILNGSESKQWAGVAFSDDENSEHFLVGLNETWMSSYIEQSKVAVIVHEIGHCIGINHSQYILYVQSKNKPGREVNGFELMDSIDIRHIVSGLETGAIFSFELLTLPFHNKCDKTVTSERKACYKTEQERVSWLKRQGDKYGFELQNVNEHASGRVYFVNRNHKTGKINRGAFMPYLYNGMLVITDGNKFRKAFIDGVGPEKCWGLGMLQLGAA